MANSKIYTYADNTTEDPDTGIYEGTFKPIAGVDTYQFEVIGGVEALV